MMKYFVWIALLMFCNVGTAKATDRSVLPNDSTVNALKIKNLNIRKADLQKQIKMEDKKRNRAIDGLCLMIRFRTEIQLFGGISEFSSGCHKHISYICY